ncbi:hypothetical protein KSP40_PGU018052 [Platanthera guangdongensis]|uniref:Uncharacterized protein n=1 Tax=Platanthera guangdongensis TaxID=2320717 RepID=A0ABR2LHQ0_9ASPA
MAFMGNRGDESRNREMMMLLIIKEGRIFRTFFIRRKAGGSPIEVSLESTVETELIPEKENPNLEVTAANDIESPSRNSSLSLTLGPDKDKSESVSILYKLKKNF